LDFGLILSTTPTQASNSQKPNMSSSIDASLQTLTAANATLRTNLDANDKQLADNQSMLADVAASSQQLRNDISRDHANLLAKLEAQQEQQRADRAALSAIFDAKLKASNDEFTAKLEASIAAMTAEFYAKRETLF